MYDKNNESQENVGEHDLIARDMEVLHYYRTALSDAQDRVAEMLKPIMESPAYIGLAGEIANAKEIIAGLESGLRESAVAAYQDTGDKKYYPGLGIRVSKYYEYSETQAIQWCIDKGFKNLLKLDSKGFEKVAAAAGIHQVGIPIIESEKATATIPTDIGKNWTPGWKESADYRQVLGSLYQMIEDSKSAPLFDENQNGYDFRPGRLMDMRKTDLGSDYFTSEETE